MSPPPATPNLNKFSYHNYVGEKLFTRDTNITRLSADETDIDSDLLHLRSTAKGPSSPALSSRGNGLSEPPVKPPKPDVKPKPISGYAKARPPVDNKSSALSSGSAMAGGRNEFKTLSMISTETSIWGSTSSAGTVRLDDELSSPLSCTTPIDGSLDHPDVFGCTTPIEGSLDHLDVFSEEMTSSLTLKHQQMVSRIMSDSLSLENYNYLH